MDFPARYAPIAPLGEGGGGQVFAVSDRITGERVALKILAKVASGFEVGALVREATLLHQLAEDPSLLLPKVHRLGMLSDGRLFLVRDVVEGESLASVIAAGGFEPAIRALQSAASQLTKLHRAGLFHGDIKPANIIARNDDSATLVDFGLSLKSGASGPSPVGFTVRYAAPEIMVGSPLSVRTEVYSLGVILTEIVAQTALHDYALERALDAVAKKAVNPKASARFPSADEFSAAISWELSRHAPAKQSAFRFDPAPSIWVIKGLETALDLLEKRVLGATPGTEIAVRGVPGSGRRTLLRALAWHFSIEGQKPTAYFDMSVRSDNFELEVATAAGSPCDLASFCANRGIVIVEDCALARNIRQIVRTKGGILIDLDENSDGEFFEMPPLPNETALQIVQTALPSLPTRVHEKIVALSAGIPGHLRTLAEQAIAKTIVRAGDVAASEPENQSTIAYARWLMDHGLSHDAESLLAHLPPSDDVTLMSAKIALETGMLEQAQSLLCKLSEGGRANEKLLLARIASKRSDYELTQNTCSEILKIEPKSSELHAEALQARGLANVYLGNDAGAVADLELSVKLADHSHFERVHALALSSLAIAHQRAGRIDFALTTYERAVRAAETAGDASAVATTHLNLGTLIWSTGSLFSASKEFEIAADLARRVRRYSTLERALINLAICDLHLGRTERVGSTIAELNSLANRLTPVGHAQLLALSAELLSHVGTLDEALEMFERAIAAWRSQSRMQDAAEVVIDEVLVRVYRQDTSQSPAQFQARLSAAEHDLASLNDGEMRAPLLLARGLVSALEGDDEQSLRDLDDALKASATSVHWRWQVHAARAQLLQNMGFLARARRERDAAEQLLDEIATQLPRDLREVFWSDPRKKQVRQAPSESLSNAQTQSLGRLTVQSAMNPSRVEDRLGRLLAINRALVGERDVSALLDRMTDHAIDLVGADAGFVLLSQESELVARAARRREGGQQAAAFSRSVCEKVLETNTPIVSNSVKSEPLLSSIHSVHVEALGSLACIPIPKIRGENRTPLGVLYLESRKKDSRCDMEQELATLLTFADLVGVALANAALLAENQERARALEDSNKELTAARAQLDSLLAERTQSLERVQADLESTRKVLQSHAGFAGYAGLVGTSPAMRELYARLERLAETDVSVLILGESGTGKEVIARAIAGGGPRAGKPFVAINCGAIPDNLLESELFGYVRGAFTGADRDKNGLFRQADGGTLLLDEIGEMPLKMQAGLLRVLQEKVVRKLGGQKEEPIDVRVLCSTHRDLESMIVEGKFRRDLFYRINVISLLAPPLRARIGDIPLLVDHFMGVFSAHYKRGRKALSRGAISKLESYDFPGNVRQLEHILLNAFLLCDGNLVEAEDISLPQSSIAHPSQHPVDPSPSRPPQPTSSNLRDHKDHERARILEALEKTGWNRAQAAIACKMSRRTFYRRLKEFEILTGDDNTSEDDQD